MESVGAVGIAYFLDSSDSERNELGDRWEKRVLDSLLELKAVYAPDLEVSERGDKTAGLLRNPFQGSFLKLSSTSLSHFFISKQEASFVVCNHRNVINILWSLTLLHELTSTVQIFHFRVILLLREK